jgi:hypothetical protein
MKNKNPRAAILVLVAAVFPTEALDFPNGPGDTIEEVFKDILVNVNETAKVNLMFGAGINADVPLIESVVEANSSQDREVCRDYR